MSAGSGSYRHVVTVQVPGPVVAADDGGYVESWQDGDPPTWSVSLEPAAADTVTAGTVLAMATHQVRGRYHASVSTRARLLFEGRVFHVTQVRDLGERQRTLELVCTELVA